MSFAVVKRTDPEKVSKAVAEYAKALARDHPEVRRVIWFGSRVTGLPGPGSDVDLCLILTRSDKPVRERGPDYLPLGFPVDMDLFCYTQREFDALEASDPAWHAAIASGREIPVEDDPS